MEATKGRVLVVDDDEVIRAMLKAILEDHYEVVCADNSIEGFRLAQFEPFDLILLDIQMPIFDGQDLCVSLKENSETSDIPIIFVTAMTSIEDQLKCFQAGASDYVCKPLVEEIVLARVKVHIDLKLQRDHLLKLSSRDPLTGLANRRCFEETLDREWRRSQRNENPLSLLAIDIDYFKRYCEHYGHTAADDCLVKVAKLLAGAVKRGGDFVARISDEKFICILPDTPFESLDLLAEKFRSVVSAANVPHEYSPIAKHVSISIGGATLAPDQKSKPSDLYDLARQQVDAALKKGGNRYSLTR